jgi:hypothetical protein
MIILGHYINILVEIFENRNYKNFGPQPYSGIHKYQAEVLTTEAVLWLPLIYNTISTAFVLICILM